MIKPTFRNVEGWFGRAGARRQLDHRVINIVHFIGKKPCPFALRDAHFLHAEENRRFVSKHKEMASSG